MNTAGIDIGSITTKAAILRDGRVLGTRVSFTGYNAEFAGRRIFDEILTDLGLDATDITKVIATGYGRNAAKFADKAVTEIICHGVGAHHLNPQVRSVIDIGGQDSKVIRLDGKGRNVDFQMNDKCAAGTGRFLEVMAHALEVRLEDLGRLSRRAPRTIKISSTCTVFAESEVVSLIADNQPKEVIIRGLHDSIADRILGLVRRVGFEETVTLTGGVAKNDGVVQALENRLKLKLFIPPEPQIIGALGAALVAREL